jgi:hypothetical protein
MDGWCRVGGRRFDFVATYTELQALLDWGLRPDEGPWGMTGSDLVLNGPRSYDAVPWVCDNTVLEGCPGPKGRRTDAWLWSSQWTPRLPPLDTGHAYKGLCAWNGLIGLQRLDDTHSDGCDVSLHLVDKVRRKDETQERQYPDYRRAFERLRRRVRATAVADTDVRARDGSEWSDHTVRWLPGAVEAYKAGGDLPGRPAL